MNKTVNINLAGVFFHIDEDAYLKLQRYLEAIKRSFTDSQGRSEIIADIEARIAELFSERIQNEKQVVAIKQVDEVIAIMGQPEDYLVDDEIFEDDATSFRPKGPSKKLFRDTDNSYIAGVASGLGHYLRIDAIWVRLLWILLTLGSAGTFILIYILFWILAPEAVTTTDKLTMTGEPVNISSIEKKIKDGFDNVSQTVSDTVKNIDFEKQGNKIKSSSKNFFDTLGDIIMFFLKLFAKFIGFILILIGAVSLFALLVSVLSFGSSSYFHPWWLDYPDALNTTGIPLWVGSVLIFLLFGIPLFFVLYLGLKILINNLKSIGRVAKYTLLGVWLLTIVGLVIISVKEASHFALESTVSETNKINTTPQDTLFVKMIASDFDKYKYSMHRSGGFEVKYNTEDEKVIFSRNVNLRVKSTTDTVASIEIIREAKGKDYIEARKTAEKIDYNYAFVNNELLLNNSLHTDYKNKFLDQTVIIFLHIPEGTILKMNSNTKSFLTRHSWSGNIIAYDKTDHFLEVLKDDINCLDCEMAPSTDNKNEDPDIKIDQEGLNIKSDSASLKINKEGIKAKSEGIKVNIDDDGIKIITDTQ